MSGSGDAARWRPRGRVCLWRYKAAPRMYGGWHFAADPDGCDSLIELLDILRATSRPAHRTLHLSDPAAVGADRIFGAHDLRLVWPPKLRLAFDPALPREAEDMLEVDDRLELRLGHSGLGHLRQGFADVRRDEADFSMRFAPACREPLDRLSFWWWPRGA